MGLESHHHLNGFHETTGDCGGCTRSFTFGRTGVPVGGVTTRLRDCVMEGGDPLRLLEKGWRAEMMYQQTYLRSSLVSDPS